MSLTRNYLFVYLLLLLLLLLLIIIIDYYFFFGGGGRGGGIDITNSDLQVRDNLVPW